MVKKSAITKILAFWFDELEPKQWFKKDDGFDAMLAERFGNLVADALGGRLDSWAKDKDGSLALILLLDQMTRNIHRNTPLAFAGDDMALAHALSAIEKGFLDEAPSLRNLFRLMPLMHSEDLNIHNKAKPLFESYTPEKSWQSLADHTAIIEKFERYPHRNAILGRPSSVAEIAFLKTPKSSF